MPYGGTASSGIEWLWIAENRVCQTRSILVESIVAVPPCVWNCCHLPISASTYGAFLVMFMLLKITPQSGSLLSFRAHVVQASWCRLLLLLRELLHLFYYLPRLASLRDGHFAREMLDREVLQVPHLSKRLEIRDVQITGNPVEM